MISPQCILVSNGSHLHWHAAIVSYWNCVQPTPSFSTFRDSGVSPALWFSESPPDPKRCVSVLWRACATVTGDRWIYVVAKTETDPQYSWTVMLIINSLQWLRPDQHSKRGARKLSSICYTSKMKLNGYSGAQCNTECLDPDPDQPWSAILPKACAEYHTGILDVSGGRA